jgi:hypothetical protein
MGVGSLPERDSKLEGVLWHMLPGARLLLQCDTASTKERCSASVSQALHACTVFCTCTVSLACTAHALALAKRVRTDSKRARAGFC